MGNRAVITTAPFAKKNVGIYLHWNGGKASIEGFLQAAKVLQWRGPTADESYALARLTQLIATYFGPDGLSVGIGLVGDLDPDNGDNGTYLIGGDWEIVGRKFYSGEEEVDPTKTAGIVRNILAKIKAADAAKPEAA